MSVTEEVAVSQPATSTSDRPRTWLRQIRTGGQIVETCPTWCASDHGHDLRSNFDDLTHYTSETLAMLPNEALIAQVRVDPYSVNPRRHVPYATFEVTDAEMLDELGPEELAAIIAKVREHCDALDGVLAQLVEARAEHAGQTTTA